MSHGNHLPINSFNFPFPEFLVLPSVVARVNDSVRWTCGFLVRCISSMATKKVNCIKSVSQTKPRKDFK